MKDFSEICENGVELHSPDKSLAEFVYDDVLIAYKKIEAELTELQKEKNRLEAQLVEWWELAILECNSRHFI